MGHESIPATLVDLAARRHLEIDLLGGDTFVRLRNDPTGLRAGDTLTSYEDMVLRHVRGLARHTDDGRVPAQALTTGPDASAKNWWRDFRSGVVADARARGLSRPRWPARLKAVLIAAAVPVAVAAALAASALPDNPDDSDDDPVSGAVAAGVFVLVGLTGVAGTRTGERDTPAGRVAAGRWLGLRELLEEDPLFAEQPPAAVAIWDHLLAQGTALGVAHGVVQALPLGAESDREAWSSVGGRWRVVRIRYPRGGLAPGYGRHPGHVTLLGLVHLVIGLPLLPLAARAATSLREALDRGALTDAGPGTDAPAGAGIAISIALAVVTVVASAVSVRGVALTFAGVADLVTGRSTVEGRVVRKRDRSTDEQQIWYLAVDDGSADRVRAWRFRSRVPALQGDTVRARVTRRLQHVTDLVVLSTQATGVATSVGAPGPAGPATGTTASDVTAAMAVLIGGDPHRDPGRDGNGGSGRAPVGTPPLPADSTISAAVGRPLVRDTDAKPHPAALGGGSAIYTAGGEGHIQVVWVPTVTLGVYRSLPAALRHDVPGLGDEGYRARFGGGVMARRGAHVVMVSPHLPGLDDGARDDIAVQVARAALALVADGDRDHAAATDNDT